MCVCVCVWYVYAIDLKQRYIGRATSTSIIKMSITLTNCLTPLCR